MNDDLLPPKAITWPLLDALFGAYIELRTPLTAMHATLDLIEIHFSTPETIHLIHPLRIQGDRLFTLSEDIFEMRTTVYSRPERYTQADIHEELAHQALQTLTPVVVQLYGDTAALYQLANSVHMDNNTLLSEDAQSIFALFLTGQETWRSVLRRVADAANE